MEEEALRVATLAVQRDSEGRLEDAANLYEEVVRLLTATRSFGDVAKQYETRARVLRLQIFEKKSLQQGGPSSLEERLQQLRGGRESDVVTAAKAAPVVFLSSDDESEGTKVKKLVEQARAEAALEGGAVAPRDIDSDDDGDDDDDDDDEEDAMALAVKAREQMLAAKAAIRMGKR